MQFGVLPRSSGPLARKLYDSNAMRERCNRIETQRRQEAVERERREALRRARLERMLIKLKAGVLEGCRTQRAEVERAIAIKLLVARAHGVTPEEIASPNRQKDIVRARWEAIYLIASTTKLSLTRIGRMFGGQDHSTILYAMRGHAKRHGLQVPRAA